MPGGIIGELKPPHDGWGGVEKVYLSETEWAAMKAALSSSGSQAFKAKSLAHI